MALIKPQRVVIARGEKFPAFIQTPSFTPRAAATWTQPEQSAKRDRAGAKRGRRPLLSPTTGDYVMLSQHIEEENQPSSTRLFTGTSFTLHLDSWNFGSTKL